MFVRHFMRMRNCQLLSKQFACLSVAQRNISADVLIKTKKDTFEDALPKIVDVLVENDKFDLLPDIGQFLREVINMNVGGGKMQRGIATIIAYEAFEQPGKLSNHGTELATVAGWCVEMMQTYLIMTDDVMDSSVTRRGKPCWYRNPDVGLRGINDALLIKCCYGKLITRFFKGKPYYEDVMELFNDTLFNTSIGQHLDSITATSNKDYSNFTIDRYNAIVTYKTAYYTFNLPLALGYLLTGNADKNTLQLIQDLSIKIGVHFQIQDDFIDVYGDPNESGKEGTDIQEGKCSWLAVKALELCSPDQRHIFQQCYGSKNPDDCKVIKQLFNDLRLPQVYKENEQHQYDDLKKDIQNISKHLSPEPFQRILDMLQNRSK